MAGYIGSKAVNLSTTGADINGDANIDGDLSFGDNDKAIFGAGSDLQIYHDGGNSRIQEQGTGNLIIRASSGTYIQGVNGENGLAVIEDGTTTAYYDGAPKLATTAAGVTISGTALMDSLRVDGNATIRDDAATTSYYSTDVASNVVTHTSNGTGAFAQEVWKLNDGGTPSERMRLTTTGLGIGTSSPSSMLNLKDWSGDGPVIRLDGAGQNSANTLLGALEFYNADSSADGPNVTGAIRHYSAESLGQGGYTTFHTHDGTEGGEGSDAPERMRIDSSGNVGIGTSSPARPFSVTDTTGDGTGGMILASYLPTLEMDDISGGGTSFILQHNTTNTIFKHDTTERMRIDSSGNLLVGESSPNPYNGLTSGHVFKGSSTAGGQAPFGIYNSSGSTSAPVLNLLNRDTSTDSTNRFLQFYANVTSSTNTPMGGIVGNGASNVQFASISDVREKENITPITGSLNKITSLNPVEFDWIASGEHCKAGFVAQEVEEIFPEFVVENMAGEGAEERKGLTGGMTGGIVAHLVKAIQEQSELIDNLTDRIAALEG